jgi:Uma2 family endonuclease
MVSLHGEAIVSVQLPIALDDISEPQPDVMVIPLPDGRFESTHPTARDALLVVEVSMSSLATDRGRKLRAYARCGVRDYWIVNLHDDRIDVYRRPRKGGYASHTTVHRGGTVTPLAFPENEISVDEILPTRAKPPEAAP